MLLGYALNDHGSAPHSGPQQIIPDAVSAFRADQIWVGIRCGDFIFRTCRYRLRRSPDVVNKRCYSKPNEFRVCHNTDIPRLRSRVRFWGWSQPVDATLCLTGEMECGDGTEISSWV